MSRVRLGALALVVVGLDQLTKLAVVKALDEGESRNVIGDFLRLSHFRNSGAAFGFLRGFGGLLALAALVGVIVFTAVVVRRPAAVNGVAAALVAAGATGNLLDRILRSTVVDFVDFRFWPAFNVADSSITIGALLLVFSSVFERPKKDE